jgi:tetratricopeptide (TPR) repeat protein
MGTDVLLQLVLVLLTIFIFISIQHFPKQALTKLRSKSKTTAQSNRHFLNGAQLLSKARSTRNKTTSINLAKHAVSEADKALSMSPKDPAAHILKALSLDLMGHRTSALKSLDAALSPPAVKSLTERERGDALVKRAEIVVAVGKRRRVEEAVADLLEAVRLGCGESGKAWWLLGKCYEVKGMREEARKAFEEAVRVEPPGSGMSQAAREGLERLG